MTTTIDAGDNNYLRCRMRSLRIKKTRPNFPDNLGVSKELWNDLRRIVGWNSLVRFGWSVSIPCLCSRLNVANKTLKPSGSIPQSNAHGTFGSFVSAARDFPPLIASVAPVSSSPALVLDDSCVVERDLSCHVHGACERY
ncbi:hypothetical protein Tco_0633880 [Tanacetum coccineum]